MFGFFLKKAFFDGWDNLLILGLLNIGYVVIIVALLAAPMAFPSSLILTVLLVLVVIFLFYFFSGGVAKYLSEIAFDRTPDLRSIPAFCIQNWKTSATLAGITSVQIIILSIGFPFYLSMGGVVAMAALSILFWVSVLWWLISMWVYPVATQLESSVKMQLKKSAIIFFDNTGFTLALGLYSLLNILLSLPTAFLIPGFTGVRLSRQIALKLRMYKYDYLEKNPEGNGAYIPWNTLLAEDQEKLGRRTLKGMLFPWKD